MKRLLIPATSVAAIKKVAFLLVCCAVLALFAAPAWAQCPASPTYKTDFSSELTTPCLTLNGSAAFGVPAFSLPPPVPPASNPPFPAPAGVNTVLRLTPNTNFQAGSAWFNTPQQVNGTFSTTFKFQLSGSNSPQGPADGIAFVIQNSSATAATALAALGLAGCDLGFGGSSTPCNSGFGIPQSLAVEFDTFQNQDDPNSNHVAIQSCGTAPNTVDSGPCRIADNSNLLNAQGNLITLADGNVHTVTISYTPSTLSTCGPNNSSSCSSIDVILDNTDLFPGGVLFDLTTIGLASGNNCSNCLAYVGLTAATGGSVDDHDILSWTFTPQSQTTVVTAGAQSTLSFQNANQNTVYDYTAQLNTGQTPVSLQVLPILMAPSDCNALVQRSFRGARCFVYENAEGSGMDSSVLFAATCPQNATCTNVNFQELGTDFQFTRPDNPFLGFPGVFLFSPFAGWLKSSDPSPTPDTPCAVPPVGPLFTSNQISSFQIVGDPGGTTKGKSPTGPSCWVGTYNTPGEALPGIRIKSPTLLPIQTFPLNSNVSGTYTCSDPSTSQSSTSAKGPYLTVASCTQSELIRPGFTTNSCTAVPGALNCTGQLDTTARGLHTLVVTAIDTGGNTNVNLVLYNVK